MQQPTFLSWFVFLLVAAVLGSAMAPGAACAGSAVFVLLRSHSCLVTVSWGPGGAHWSMVLSTTRSSLWYNTDLPLTVKSCDWSQGQLTSWLWVSALRATTWSVLSSQRLRSAGQLCSGHSPSLCSALHCYLLPLVILVVAVCHSALWSLCRPRTDCGHCEPRHHPRPVSTCPVQARHCTPATVTLTQEVASLSKLHSQIL